MTKKTNKFVCLLLSERGVVAQMVERATSGQEVVGLIPTPGPCSLLICVSKM